MKILHKTSLRSGENINISGSKSESNRLLVLQKLFGELQIDNLSNAEDTRLLQKALQQSEDVIDIHHAGTAMRFLTAYFATQEGREVVLTGSSRMKERPIKILVDALKTLGAEIFYTENEGFPPLKIKGKKLEKNEINIPANISSQYISALMLIAPPLSNGLEINLLGEITSAPYINMSLKLLTDLGVEASFSVNKISVKPIKTIKNKNFVVESDWSSASYWYSFIALSEVGSGIRLSSYKKDSLQGDSILQEIYRFFGVSTTFLGEEISLKKEKNVENILLEYDLVTTPDIAQTIAVTCFGLGIGCHLRGLHTLKIKETDRLVALKNELEKLGAKVEITKDSLSLKPSQHIIPNIEIETYNDHRMAMSFAALSLKTDIIIKNPNVVEKSYPDFWKDFCKLTTKI